MKVVLFALNASWAHTNLAVRCLREPLERAGFAVTVAEYHLHDRTSRILERLWREDADIYGFSCYIWNLAPMLSIAEQLHALRPGCRILLGGPEVSFDTGRFDGLSFIDGIVTGEGEEALPEVCRRIAGGLPFDRVTAGGAAAGAMADEGILYRDGEDCGGGVLYYESSRGCPYSCAYCLSSATRGVRMKSAEQTLADLRRFETLRADCKIVKFVDRTFNADAGRANRIWQGLLDGQYTRRYHFEICAALLDEESFSVLSRFPPGKIQLECGLQSTNPATLEAVARHIRPQQVLQAVRRLHGLGNIHVHLDLIAGLPYESYARFAQSFDEAWGSCDRLQLGFLKLLHGTALRGKMAEYGYLCEPGPPYTVLQNRWISYPELCRLSRMAQVLERYADSGRFVRTLRWLLPRVPSPFRFWEGLTDFLETADPRPLQRLSQPDAYRYLLAYAGPLLPEGAEELRGLLRADFAEQEHKKPPRFLAGAVRQ